MALKPKHPHICIDEKIWDDPVMIEISPSAFRVYIFAIAWSKSQGGRTPDGLLTVHGISRVGATLELLQELTEKNLMEKREDGYKIVKYEDWQKTSEEERLGAERAAVKSEIGKNAAAVRWNKPSAPVEEGFNVDAAFEESWSEWPEPSEARYTEKQSEAKESFSENIRNAKDYALFQAALMKRVRSYQSDTGAKADRRRFLGAFKNFCAERWRDWIPKSRVESKSPAVVEPGTPTPDALTQALLQI